MRNLYAHITRTATAAHWGGVAMGSRASKTMNPAPSLTVMRVR
jgi:hypothetical protein